MPPFDPDPQQLRVLEHARGPMRVRGGWGSGKSAALRWRFRRLVTEGDPERVALVLRSRRECDESRRVLQDDLRMALPSLRIVTMQGLARIVLQQRIGADAPEILTADPHFARVAELLAAEDPAAWPAYGRLLPMRGFTDEVRQFLLRAQESLLTPEDIVARAAERHLSGWKELATFYARYLDVLADANETDFAGLVWRAVVEGPQGAPILDHLLVDDMHDVTEGGARLIRDLTTISTVVAGNEAAHVFSFQGTTVEPFRRFAEDLHAVEEVTFTTTWRGAGRTARAWKAPHGADEHAAIARELRRIHVAEDVAWRDLAVVARRQGANVAGVVRALEDARIPHHVPEGGIAFTTESATWPYTLALRWIARPDLRDDLVEELLTSRLGGVSPASARMLMRAALRAGDTVAGALARRDGLTADEATSLEGLVAALGRAEALAGNVADAFAALWQDLSLSRRLVAEDEGDALDAVLALSQAVTEASESADGSVAAFVASLDARGDAPDLARLRDSGADAVQVLTAHAAAGREFDTVIVAGAVEGEFPSLHRPEHMFDLGVLARRRSETERNVERLSDERRLFDLVVARARRGVLFTASQAGEEDGGSATSRFVDVPWEPAPDPAEDAPVSVADAVDRWRVDLADDGRDPADRLLALEGLLAIGERPDRWWLLHDWTEPPVPYTGPATLSFSRISALLDCELKFLLGAELGLDAPGGYHAWVGSLVHAVVEACERGDMPRSLDALRQAVAARWDRSQFPSTAIADANLHVALERMLPNWWNAYGRREPALAVEQPFRFEVDGVRFSGKIDRIEAVDPDDPDAGTRIIDYKTGKPKGRVTDQAPTEEHALQLLTYFVAANRDEALAAFRPVRSLEIAFLRGDDGASSIPAPRTIDVPAEAHDATLADAEERLAGYVARIRAIAAEGTAAPTPSFSCRHCAFKMLCPAFQGRPSVPVERVGA